MKREVLTRLIRAIVSGDSQAIQEMLSVVVEEERKLGHSSVAHQLEKIISRSAGLSEPKSLSALQPLSSLSSKNEIGGSFVVEIPRERLRHGLIFSEEIERRFERIKREYGARERLAEYGLRYRQKVLLYGVPGCGKTTGAERIAWDTGLPLVKVQFEAIVSRYLGETGRNLREVFEGAAKSPCVLFIDECDALAKFRGDSQDVGEINRVVNTFLQLLEEYEGTNGILVAATNLTEHLDRAVWRRFDDAIEIPKPTEREIEIILKQSFSSVEVGSIDWKAIVQKMSNFSAAQVVKVSQDAAKRTILDRLELVSQEHIEESIQEIFASSV